MRARRRRRTASEFAARPRRGRSRVRARASRRPRAMRAIGALGELLAPGEWLLTAHHADDQLETLLLRHAARHGRPRLARHHRVRAVRRRLARPAAARVHARGAARSKRSPGSSLGSTIRRTPEPRHDRNYLRLHVLPALRARWPTRGAARRAPRRADERRGAAARGRGGRGRARARRAVARAARGARRARPPARQRNLLRYLLRAVGLGTPSARKVEELRRALLEARAELARARALAERRRPRLSRGAVSRSRRCRPRSPPGYAARIAPAATGPAPKVGSRSSPARDGRRLAASRGSSEGLTLRFRARRRAISSARPRPSSLVEASVSGERRRAVDARPRAAAVSRRTPSLRSATCGSARTSTPRPPSEPRWRVQWTEHPPVRAPERR